MRPRLVFALGGLVIAIAAIAAAIYVLVEPAAAIAAVRDDPGSLSAKEQRELIEGRFHEAGGPLVAGSLAGVVALAAALLGRKHPLGAAAILAACVGLAGCAYVWARYGEGIWGRLAG